MEVECSKYAPLISGLIDNEITSSEESELRAHLEKCSTCTLQFNQEKKVKQSLQDTYRTEVAPVHLRTRVRRALSDIAPSPGFWDLLAQLFSRHTLKATFSVAGLVLLAALPYVMNVSQDKENLQNTASSPLATIAGALTCADCEIMYEAGHSKTCAEYHHLGIRDQEGRLWRFTDASAGKDLLRAGNNMQRQFQVQGHTLSDKHYNYISVNRLEKI